MFMNHGNPRGFPRGGGGRGMPAGAYNNGYAPMGYEFYPGYDYSMDFYDYGYGGYPEYGAQVCVLSVGLVVFAFKFKDGKGMSALLTLKSRSRAGTVDTATRFPTPVEEGAVVDAAVGAK